MSFLKSEWTDTYMTWNYRIVYIHCNSSGQKLAHPWYGLFEVYNNSEGLPYTRTKDPVGFVGDESQEVIKGLGMAFNDALKYPILDDDDIKDENEDRNSGG